MRWFFLLVSCRACVDPELPSNHDDDDDSQKEDSQDSPVDSEDSDSPPDSGPPVFCTMEEPEPNGTLQEAMAIPMESWVCGNIDQVADADFYSLTTTEPGWITIDLQAASRGSFADMDLAITDGDRTVTVFDGYLSTDPRIVFPADVPGTYLGWVSEHDPLQSGDSYTWFMRASLSKPAIGWSREEVETNGPAQENAEPLLLEERIFGTISDSEDIDWFHITTPADATAVILDIEAYSLGSPLNTSLVIRDAEGDIVKWVTSGEIDYDLDPHAEIKTEGAQDWYLQVFNPDEKGSRFHWYTLVVTAEYQ